MTQCDYCGKEIQTLSAFTCSYCGKIFCPEHRLPFNHNCANIEAWKQAPLPGQKGAQQKAARNPISTNSLSSRNAIRDSPWIIVVGIIVLILIGIVIGTYVL